MTARHNLLIAAVLLAAPMAAAPAEAPTKLGEPAAAEGSDRELEDAVRAMREAFPAGERVENWNVGGADIQTQIHTLGADEYYLVVTDPTDGSMDVVMMTERPIADLAPSAWRVAQSIGSAETLLDNPTVTFGLLTARYAMAIRSGSRRLGRALCAGKIGQAILYEVPGAPEAPEDKVMSDMFKGPMVSDQTLCARFDGDREQGYSVRHFLGDGRPVLNPDLSLRASRALIVAAAPVDTLIRPPAPVVATPPR